MVNYSSTLSSIITILFEENLAARAKKADFFLSDSTSTAFFTPPIDKTIPGKPPPEPISKILS
jgi:hypothetical protein